MRLVTPRVAEVRWRVPAVSNGYIIKYIVYAIPLGGTTRQRRQAVVVTTPQTIQSVCNYYHHGEDFIIYSVHLCVCVCVYRSSLVQQGWEMSLSPITPSPTSSKSVLQLVMGKPSTRETSQPSLQVQLYLSLSPVRHLH